MATRPDTGQARAAALVAAAAALVTAWPILGNYFYFDDFAHFYQLLNFGPRRLVTSPYGGHMCMVRNAVWYGSFLAFGMRPEGYFATVLATHVVNVVMVFVLVRRLGASPWLACLAAVLFATAPANLGTLGWYSAYGHALATTATLLALLIVTPARGDDRPLGWGAALGAATCMLIASQSFGTGAAIAIVFPAMAVLLRPATLRARGPLAMLGALPVLVGLAWWTFYVANATPDLATPAGKVFLGLALQHRDVVRMASLVSGFGIVDLVLGAGYAPGRYPDTLSAATLATVLAILSWAMLRAAWPARRVLLAFLLAALACYGAVAAGRGALLFSGAVPDDHAVRTLAVASRYQYLAQAMLAVALGVALREAARGVPWSARTGHLLLGVWVSWAVASSVLLRRPVDHFDAERAIVRAVRDRIDQAIRSKPPGSIVSLPIEPAVRALGFPGSAGIFLLFHPSNVVDGRRVYFVAADPEQRAALRAAGGRMGELLLPLDMSDDVQVPAQAVLAGLGTHGSFRQRFLARCDGLAGLEIPLAAAAASTEGSLRVALMDAASSRVVWRRDVPRSELALDGSWHLFLFPPLWGSAGKGFTIILTAIKNKGEATVFVLGGRGDPYPEGDARAPGKVIDGDASFRYGCAPPASREGKVGSDRHVMGGFPTQPAAR